MILNEGYDRMKSGAFLQSNPKRKILYFLKVMRQGGLKDLSKVMKISRMAVHKHLSELQDRGLVESIEIRKGVGRPPMQYSLTSTGKTAFPKSYGEIATHALDYLEKKWTRMQSSRYCGNVKRNYSINTVFV